MIRPEKVRISSDGGEPGVVREVVYLGPVTRYVVELDSGETLVALRQNSERADEGPSRDERVRLTWGTHLEEVAL
jgi:putative spermidine/putrescine transport system ATP-binding protein